VAWPGHARIIRALSPFVARLLWLQQGKKIAISAIFHLKHYQYGLLG
jgi:hypothetical protein